MAKRIYILFGLFAAIIITSYIGIRWVQASGDDDIIDFDKPVSHEESEWVYGMIEYEHDILAPDKYFMKLRVHPGSSIPNIVGGYATTDVYVELWLRGVQVPTGRQTKSDRDRPHLWLDGERERWNRAIKYVWSVCNPTRTFRVHNIEALEKDNILVGDIEFLLGGQWHVLAIAMINDKVALPTGDWDFGDIEFGAYNPNIP